MPGMRPGRAESAPLGEPAPVKSIQNECRPFEDTNGLGTRERTKGFPEGAAESGPFRAAGHVLLGGRLGEEQLYWSNRRILSVCDRDW